MQCENDSNVYFRVKIIYFPTGANSLLRQEVIFPINLRRHWTASIPKTMFFDRRVEHGPSS